MKNVTTIKTIEDLEVGDYVIGRKGISRVAECIHGNLYYAYQGEDREDAERMHVDLPDDLIEVSDDDVNHLADCGC